MSCGYRDKALLVLIAFNCCMMYELELTRTQYECQDCLVYVTQSFDMVETRRRKQQVK